MARVLHVEAFIRPETLVLTLNTELEGRTDIRHYEMPMTPDAAMHSVQVVLGIRDCFMGCELNVIHLTENGFMLCRQGYPPLRWGEHSLFAPINSPEKLGN